MAVPPTPPSNLNNASVSASWDVQVVFQNVAKLLRTQLDLFLTTIASTTVGLDPNDIANRTVLNWVAIGQELLVNLPTVKASENQVHAGNVAVLVYRICKAASTASSATPARITAAQRNAIITAYATAWQ